MRKTICGGCGKFIEEGSLCECKKAARKDYLQKVSHDPMLNSYRWRKKREFIKRRDNYMCQRCLIKFKLITTTELEAHHIKSRVNHPELAWDDENLICICKTCNLQLGTKDKLDFEWKENDNNFNL